VNKFFDVVEVNTSTLEVRVIARDKSEADAEAIIQMAVIRRGVEESFYTSAPPGRYDDGDKYGRA
jgi:hypothetical protein